MAVSILALRRGLADITIPIGEDELHVTYRPGVITPGFNDARFWDQPAWLSQVIERWDLVDDAGETVPLTQVDDKGSSIPSDGLRSLPNDFLLLVQREINRDLLPGKRLRGTSTAG